VPYDQPNHWILALIDWNDQTIRICDSLPDCTSQETVQETFETNLLLLKLVRPNLETTVWKLIHESVSNVAM
jgi:Ulp1 family protease